jgi:hypothetical protein
MIVFDEERRYYNDDKFNAYGLPLVRRAFPELFANTIVRCYSN